jgi:hypothetical protein
MRWLPLGLVVLGAFGCATVQPFMVSDQQRARFEQVVQQAEAAAATGGPAEALEVAKEARSDFEYAQHLPKYPERARALAAQAQQEAETALRMTQQAHHQAELAASAATASTF